MIKIQLETQGVQVDDALAVLEGKKVMARIWAHDHTVWKPEPAEIANRLGWLHIASSTLDALPRLEALRHQVQHVAGYQHVLLLGMGGSSLAPDVLSRVFGAQCDGLSLHVLDNTAPGAVQAYADQLDLARTLFIVATKSGGTVETLSFFKFFYNRVAQAVGADQAGAHFIAITDPGSRLAALAEQYHFRDTFLNDPNIGGRYSVLSFFGMVPAALIGIDLKTLLNRALTMAGNGPVEGNNHGARLGTIMGKMAQAGRDKLTLVSSAPIAPFGDWVEQLVAESTGKEGKGILPVVGEPLGPPEVYGNDRLFVHLRLENDDADDDALDALAAAGHPLVRLHLHDLYDLGGQFFLWEMATAVASHWLGINPFDQPNVEAAKKLARAMVKQYQEQGTLPRVAPAPLAGHALAQFLTQARPGDYLSLQAYLFPTPEIDAALTSLRLHLRDRYRLATTVGYGPRFLHSTGQLHKGDAGNGMFIQFTADHPADLPIPDQAGSPESAITFGVLQQAQAAGDRQALLDASRRVIHFDLGSDAIGSIYELVKTLP